MKSPIDLIGGFYTVDGLNWACQDTVNYLPMAAEAGGTKTPTMLKSPPGLKPFSNIGDGPDFVIRGMHDVEGQLFVVSGNRLYQLMTTTGVAIPIGEIPGVGRVSMSHNQIAGGNQLLVVNGQSGYIYNTRTQEFQRITDPGYPGAFAADFIDGYFVQVEPFGRYVFHNNLADGLDYNTLDRFEAESQPDNIVALLVVNDEVRVFGSRTQQIFTNTGAAQGTFQSKGITIDRGCAGRFTPARLDNGVFFLGDDGVVYRDNGYNPVRISTHAIEEAIADNDWSQAFAFTWQAHGHSVYYLTFPDGQTWGYDIASQLWHRRSTYHPSFEVSRRWRLNALVYSRGKWYGGDSTSGRIYTLDWDYMMDGDQPLVSERTSQVTYNAGNRFQVQELEIIPRTGEKATASGEFITQPEGPTIAGDAPNGIIGQPYTYQYTITPGDAPVTSVRVVGSALPSGWSISNTGLLTGPANAAIKFDFRVRATDENGLWDEISDSIEIGAAWWLVRTDEGNVPTIWISGDPLIWPASYTVTPFVAASDLASQQLTEDRVFIGSLINTPIYLPKSPSGTNLISEQSTAPAFTRVARFDGIALGFFDGVNATRYHYTIDGGDSWVEVVVGGGLRIWNIQRLKSGRWIAYRELDSNYGMVYSDQDIPTAWTASGSSPQVGRAPYQISTDGETALMLLTNNRVYRTRDGASWEAITPVTGDMPLPYVATYADGTFFFAGQPSTVDANTICFTRDEGLTFDCKAVPSILQVDSIHHESGWLVVAGRAFLGGSTTLIASSQDLGETWQESAMPFPVNSSASCICFPVK